MLVMATAILVMATGVVLLAVFGSGSGSLLEPTPTEKPAVQDLGADTASK